MSYKIYKTGAFVIVEDSTSNLTSEFNSQTVQIEKLRTAVTSYDFLVNGQPVFTNMFLTEITDGSGNAYTSNSFDTFRFTQVGKQNVDGVGAQGPVGPAGLVWEGAWVSGTSYAITDAVSYNGSSYTCVLATAGTTTPDVDTTHWELLASRGSQGSAGIPGPVGPAGLNWQGAWVSGASYVADDAVGYSGASYFCINATSGTTTPDLDTANWALLASQGAIGPIGPQGPIGPAGTNTLNLADVLANGNSLATLNNNNFQGDFAGFSSSGNTNNGIGVGSLSLNSGSFNNAIGQSTAGSSTFINTSYVVAVGHEALIFNTASRATGIGFEAGRSNIATDLVAIGTSAGYSNTGNSPVFIGFEAGYQNSGVEAVAVGRIAGSNNTGNALAALGTVAGNSNTGANVVAIGGVAAFQNSGANAIGVGFEAARQNSGPRLVGIGGRAGYLNSGDDLIAIGNRAGDSNTGDSVIALGALAGVGNTLNNQFIVANTSMPTFTNHAAAVAAIQPTGIVGNTYLYHNQATDSIGAVRL